MTVRVLSLDTLVLDESLQVRQRLDDDTVDRYREVLSELPPVLVYDIDGTLYLTDGFHRVAAYRRDHQTSIPADVRTGTREEAEEAAISENARHGRPLARGDKEIAVRRLLGRGRSTPQIARIVACSQSLVVHVQKAERVRKAINIDTPKSPSTTALSAIQQAPQETWQSLADASARHGWTAQETQAAVREITDERVPLDRKQAYVEGRVDVPMPLDAVGRPTVAADTIRRQQRERLDTDEILLVQTMLHDLARLRALDQAAVVEALLAYQYRETALADMDALDAWLHDVMAAVRAGLRKPLSVVQGA
jgi:hypothetical protein